jgi:hypothetical protein
MSTTRLYNANGMEIGVGDVARYNGKPVFIERIFPDGLVGVTTMDERKLFIRLWPKQLGLVVEKRGAA